MRRIGSVEKSSHAARFCDYLVTLGIHASSEPSGSSAESNTAESDRREIWVKDERRVDEAKAALDAFLLKPDEARYLSSSADAANFCSSLDTATLAVILNVNCTAAHTASSDMSGPAAPRRASTRTSTPFIVAASSSEV